MDSSRRARPFWGSRRTLRWTERDRKSTRLNSSHANISYADFCLKKNINLAVDADIQRDRAKGKHIRQCTLLLAQSQKTGIGKRRSDRQSIHGMFTTPSAIASRS